ncbi:MAG TPA: hypothetical protein DDW27_14890, partial [Bacteroidales bacterium]|nr:hypothetical protein [Bacteroidales bacterium]
MRFLSLIIVFIMAHTGLSGSGIKAGIGRKVITPDPVSIWMGGYAARTKPATGVIHNLWAKAIVFEDSKGEHFILVTTDLISISRQISEDVSERIIEKFGIPRSHMMFTCSHNHSGPVILPSYFEFTPAELQSVALYGRKLTNDIFEVVCDAWNDLQPAKLSSGHGLVTFGRNRRDQSIKIRPEDPDVPVLAISAPDGKLRAVLFGYACHNTTLTGDNYEINGDYAGFAQIELENRYKGITALFFQGCGADIDPSPRGTMAHARQHGLSIANAVSEVLSGELKQVNDPIRAGLKVIDLEFRPLDIEYYNEEILSQDKYRQRRARMILESYNKGWDMSRIQYPVQAVRFGDDLTFIGLG